MDIVAEWTDRRLKPSKLLKCKEKIRITELWIKTFCPEDRPATRQEMSPERITRWGENTHFCWEESLGLLLAAERLCLYAKARANASFRDRAGRCLPGRARGELRSIQHVPSPALSPWRIPLWGIGPRSALTLALCGDF